MVGWRLNADSETGAMFKQFFAVTGDYPNFTWLPGQEQIPDNWYRRTSTNQYGFAGVVGDLGIQFGAYPDSFKFGGNVNGVNTYTGVDLANFTNGAYHAGDLTDPNKAACFYAQFAQAGIPDAANLPLSEITPVTSLINKYITPITGSFDCPVVDKFDQSLFNQFPGYKYSPSGPDTNYKL